MNVDKWQHVSHLDGLSQKQSRHSATLIDIFLNCKAQGGVPEDYYREACLIWRIPCNSTLRLLLHTICLRISLKRIGQRTVMLQYAPKELHRVIQIPQQIILTTLNASEI